MFAMLLLLDALGRQIFSGSMIYGPTVSVLLYRSSPRYYEQSNYSLLSLSTAVRNATRTNAYNC